MNTYHVFWATDPPVVITASRFEVGHSVAGTAFNSLRFYDDEGRVVEEFASHAWGRVSLEHAEPSQAFTEATQIAATAGE